MLCFFWGGAFDIVFVFVLDVIACVCLVDGVFARRCYCCFCAIVLDGVVVMVVMIFLVGDIVVVILVLGVSVVFFVSSFPFVLLFLCC